MTADRYRPLAAKQAVSQQDLDDAVANQRAASASVDSAKAALDEAQLNLGYCRITSPVDGVGGNRCWSGWEIWWGRVTRRCSPPFRSSIRCG